MKELLKLQLQLQQAQITPNNASSTGTLATPSPSCITQVKVPGGSYEMNRGELRTKDCQDYV